MSYLPPTASKPFLSQLNLAAAVAVATGFVGLVKAADKGHAKGDPSSIAALLQFPDGQILWDAKLAVDADGVDGKRLDPFDGQDDTSWHFADGSPLDSRRHPFLVLPLSEYRDPDGELVQTDIGDTGLKLGDVAVVIYRNQITGAMFGDAGPHDRLGEASISVHEGLMPAAPDCCHRDAGQCERIIDASIENCVIVIAFPGSALNHGDLTPDNFEEMIKAHAYDLFSAMGGAVNVE